MGMLMAVSSEDNEISPGTQLTTQQAACMWLKANEPIWRRWLPAQDQTSCEAGKGLIHYEEQFVESRAVASSCDWCPKSHKSVEIVDDRGRTHICTATKDTK